MLKLVIFDLDGTLVEFKIDYEKSKKEVISVLEEIGLNERKVWGKTINDIIRNAQKLFSERIDENEFKKLRRLLYKRIEKYEMEAAKSTKLIPGAMDILSHLRRNGVKIALVTNNNRKATELTLRRLKISNFFHEVVTRDDVENFKPRPDQILYVLEKTGVSKEEAIYIGDSEIDVIAAKSAGIKMVLVSPKTTPLDVREIQLKPDFIIKDLNELSSILITISERGKMFDRDDALKLISDNVKNDKILKHMLAVEAIMRGLAEYFGEDPDKWGLTGLLHDLDYEKTMDTPEKHGLLASDILSNKVPEEVLRAIKAHNYENTGVQPLSRMEKALIASDSLSGLIVACALVMPSKKLDEVKVRTIRKKFKAKDFARGIDRKRILICEEIGLELDKFFEIALESMKKISDKLGL